MATNYPGLFIDDSGQERFKGTFSFTDATSQPAAGVATVRGPYSFAFDTAGLTTGVTIYTPAVSDILLDAWIEVTTAFDGTTPLGDLGTFSGNAGLFKFWQGAPVDLSVVDAAVTDNTGLLFGASTASKNFALAEIGGASNRTIARVTTASPLKLVVSQTGAKGGTAIGGAAGAGRVYIVTATPVAL